MFKRRTKKGGGRRRAPPRFSYLAHQEDELSAASVVLAGSAGQRSCHF
jgi:hypothetical protein